MYQTCHCIKGPCYDERSRSTEFWTAGVRLAESRDFSWHEESQFVTGINNKSWFPGEPRNKVGKDCVSLKVRNILAYGLKNDVCNVTKCFICKGDYLVRNVI